ncbi:MAG: hypothetical protein R3C52_03140 [Hyphomonadaceae bacterium]
MKLLVEIDLTNADLTLFEAYERAVLTLLPEHGGRLEARVRSLDGAREHHLIAWGDAAGYAAYRNDPRRLALSDDWAQCGARASVVEVADV